MRLAKARYAKKLGRWTTVIHFLCGLLVGLAGWFGLDMLAILGFMGFIIYELTEDWKIDDGAWKEICEFMAGFFLITALAIGFSLLG